MASPRFVRVAIAASVATTGAAAYYFLSEGGDAKKFDLNLRDTQAKINNTVASARTWTEQTADTLRAGQAALSSAPLNGEEEKPVEERSDSEQMERKERTTTQERPQRQTGAYCHTCSGPRIWFFAEKLRLKRRITPYPDPPQD